jgi:hypothetical protein
MTSEQRVKALFPAARATRYKDAAKRAYYLVWSRDQYAIGAKRLGEGKTASAALVNAASRLEMSQRNVSADIA